MTQTHPHTHRHVSPNPVTQLVLGVLTFLIFQPLGIAAWIFAGIGLAKRDSDPAQASSMANIAKWCNIIGIVGGILLWIVIIGIFGLTIFGIGAAASAANDANDAPAVEQVEVASPE